MKYYLYMKIDIFCKNIELDAPLKQFVEEKVGDLEKYIGHGPAEARVEIGKPSLHHRSGPFFRAEINLKVGGQFLRGEEQHEDLRAAIVRARDEVKIQIAKMKEKNSR